MENLRLFKIMQKDEKNKKEKLPEPSKKLVQKEKRFDLLKAIRFLKIKQLAEKLEFYC